MKKVIDAFNKLSEQSRYGVVIFIVILIVLLDVVFLALPQLGSIGAANNKIRDMGENTRQIMTDKARIGSLKKNLEETRLQFTSLSNKVRALQEVPAILTTISSVANQYGVQIDQLVPDQSGQQALTKTPEAQYYALPVTIKARGGYHNFGRFINKLENSELFFIMKDFIIQNEAANPNRHVFSLTINLILADRTGGARTKNL
ncbi:MAG: type 4a pilus biogenesis protein PilO [Candidatus Omnitrophica bacterium]|nr:type 4a pilus biogenesis protein PilO [Candidatus Omnitrophota bacterium]MDE2221589.1 type 4a pilus biogenesis protein PilO [Candidatus Omnitrophota bacterium]